MEEEEYYEEEMEDEIDYELLLELKKKYFDIYQAEVHGIIFTYRSLGFSEFDEIRNTIPEEAEREEMVCRMAVLDPEVEDWSNEIYGMIPQMLAHQILKSSLLTMETAGEVKRYRLEQEMLINSSVEHQVALLIKEAFPEFKFEEILSWSIRKMCRYEAYAIYTLSRLRGMQMETGDELEKQIEQEKLMNG